MALFACENCRLKFDAIEASICPRCTSRKIKAASAQGKPEAKNAESKTSNPSPAQPAKHSFAFTTMGESKDTWKQFHSQEISGCPDCGGNEFDFDWKHKEKICKKCGNVVRIPRRPN